VKTAPTESLRMRLDCKKMIINETSGETVRYAVPHRGLISSRIKEYGRVVSEERKC